MSAAYPSVLISLGPKWILSPELFLICISRIVNRALSNRTTIRTRVLWKARFPSIFRLPIEHSGLSQPRVAESQNTGAIVRQWVQTFEIPGLPNTDIRNINTKEASKAMVGPQKSHSGWRSGRERIQRSRSNGRSRAGLSTSLDIAALVEKFHIPAGTLLDNPAAVILGSEYSSGAGPWAICARCCALRGLAQVLRGNYAGSGQLAREGDPAYDVR